MRRSRSGSFSSVEEPGTRARGGEFWFYKEEKGEGVVQREGTRSFTSRGLGPVPDNVEGNLHLAHFRYEGCDGFPVLGSPTPRKGLREKVKERGRWGEAARLQSKLFSHRGSNADGNHVHPLLYSLR